MSQLDELFHKFLNRTITPEEEQRFFALIGEEDNDPALAALIDEVIARNDFVANVPPEKADRILSLILQTAPAPARRVALWPRVRLVAAAVLLVVAGSTWLLADKKSDPPVAVTGQPSTHSVILPARSGAVLTLADGHTIVLDSAASGVIARESGTTVTLKDRLLAYNDTGAGSVTYNILSTPRGRLFDLVLPDGTRVWLNTESALRYPTRFTGAERVVELTGEAWFEVAHNEKMPFKVKTTDGSEVEVLGTGFNINAYPNEGAVRTTLLHGRVRVSAPGAGHQQLFRILQPGEQSTVAYGTITDIPVRQVDTAQVMAWKNGIFNFERAGIGTVMRQLERWYDIEVVYEKGVPDITFAGKMGRDLSLQQVLRILEISKVHYRIEQDRKLIITP